ncbi:hypothetical protein P153DRAFT_158876 [Dothidotthia symphoricarpi CBS 119687]|uniref:Uncharacterized protein n=1 Tax=Dothidotthia symphoricarpi CBS 119687 TaxID=1392245 RepID=A0A6A6AQV0_9PLEO|nr:uncharacterized protein P153DRAFT_158876 [Dothidotthia symphoricarpi CBS 119687]KAF2133548.1 hypothetical protein P153DRAFT_158876 [Dothidotthia symphoricarpi CBS 119687]
MRAEIPLESVPLNDSWTAKNFRYFLQALLLNAPTALAVQAISGSKHCEASVSWSRVQPPITLRHTVRLMIVSQIPAQFCFRGFPWGRDGCSRDDFICRRVSTENRAVPTGERDARFNMLRAGDASGAGRYLGNLTIYRPSARLSNILSTGCTEMSTAAYGPDHSLA